MPIRRRLNWNNPTLAHQNKEYFDVVFPGRPVETRTVSVSMRSHLKVPALLETINIVVEENTKLINDFCEIMNATLNSAQNPEHLAQIDEDWVKRQVTQVMGGRSQWHNRSPLSEMTVPPRLAADEGNLMHVTFVKNLNVLRQARNNTFFRGPDNPPFTLPVNYHWPVLSSPIRRYTARFYMTSLQNRATVQFVSMLKKDLFWRMRIHFGGLQPQIVITRRECEKMWKFLVRVLAQNNLPPPRAANLPAEHSNFVMGVLVPLLQPFLPAIEYPLLASVDKKIPHWPKYLFILLNLQRQRQDWLSNAPLDTFRPPPAFNVGPLHLSTPQPVTIDKNGLHALYNFHRQVTGVALEELSFSRTFAVRKFLNKAGNVRPGPSLRTDGMVAHQSIEKVFLDRQRPFDHRSLRFTRPTRLERGDIVLGADPNKPELTMKGVRVRNQGQSTVSIRRRVPFRALFKTKDYYEQSCVFPGRDKRERFDVENGIDVLNNQLTTSRTSNVAQLQVRLARWARNGPAIVHLYNIGPSKENGLSFLRNRDKFLHRWGRTLKYVGSLLEAGRPVNAEKHVQFSASTYRFFNHANPPPPAQDVVLAVGQLGVVYAPGLPGLTAPLKRIATMLLSSGYVRSMTAVNEHLTSKICSRCVRRDVVLPPRMVDAVRRNGSKIWRLKYCRVCHQFRNRDLNAAINILLVFLHQNTHNGERLPQLAFGRR